MIVIDFIGWWWQRYKLGWQCHTVLYVLTEVVIAPAIIIAAFCVAVGALPFTAAFPLGVLGVAVSVVEWVSLPELPYPRRPERVAALPVDHRRGPAGG